MDRTNSDFFPAWFFVATHSALLAIKLSENFTVEDHSILSKGEYYGISVPRDRDSVLHNKVIAKTENKLEIRSSNPPFEIFQSTDITSEKGSIHQLIHKNKKIFLTVTERNEIAISSESGGQAQTVKIDDYDEDVNHINSLFSKGQYIAAVLRNHRSSLSELVVFRESDMSVVNRSKLWHNFVHNLFIENNKMYYNATLDRSLIRVDVSNGEVDGRLRLPGHVKGMSVIDDLIIVGVSEVVGREDRPTAYGQLAVVDRKKLSLVKLIDINFDYFQKPSGNVNEIRCISGAERGEVCEEDPSIPPSSMHLNEIGPLREMWQLLFVGSIPETFRIWFENGSNLFPNGGDVFQPSSARTDHTF